jgi:hypothetical protein
MNILNTETLCAPVALRLRPTIKNRLVKLAASVQIRRGRVVTWSELAREALERYLTAEEAR